MIELLQISIPSLRKEEEQAHNEYINAKHTHVEQRDLFLRSLETSTVDATQANAIHKIRTKDKNRQEWREVKRIFGKQMVGGLRAIEVEENGQWQRITDRHAMEEAIAAENSSRFQLTQGTPLMTKDSVERFGFLAELPDARKVWKGTLQMEGLSEETRFSWKASKIKATQPLIRPCHAKTSDSTGIRRGNERHPPYLHFISVTINQRHPATSSHISTQP